MVLTSLGCHNSNKRLSQNPTPSPTPALANQTAPPSVMPVTTQAQAVLAIPIQVQPPVSFTAEQFPSGQPVQFIVHGSAGKFLRVKVDLGSFDPMHSITAQLPDKSRQLPALRDGGDSAGNFIYRLPNAGDYPVEFDSGGREAGIEFSFLASDDPMVTPGIEPEQIAIDFAPFARPTEMKLALFGQWPGYMDDWQPSHWAVENGRLEFRIMQVAGYKKVFDYPGTKRGVVRMENLEAALKPGANIPADISLPYPAYGDAGVHFSTRPQLFEGEGWRGLRRINAYAQDDGCIFSPHADLAYVFEGISNDGRFFILMRSPVANLQVSRRLDKDCTSGAKTAGAKADSFFKNEMPVLFDKAIAGADPASFQPNLDQLDAVIRSLKLKQ
jgi:hypothetical protein